MALFEFSFKFVSKKAVKGQVLVDFLNDHLCLDVEGNLDPIEITFASLNPWKLYFDGSSTQDLTQIGIVI